METHTVYRRQRSGCYSDIVQGSAFIVLFVATQLALYGMLDFSFPLVSGFPPSPVMAALAVPSQGDIVTWTIITAYGAIWGVRLIGDAIEKLRDLSELESVSRAVA
jgi:uncharacterized membrane protein (DUF485 family)